MKKHQTVSSNTRLTRGVTALVPFVPLICVLAGSGLTGAANTKVNADAALTGVGVPGSHA